MSLTTAVVLGSSAFAADNPPANNCIPVKDCDKRKTDFSAWALAQLEEAKRLAATNSSLAANLAGSSISANRATRLQSEIGVCTEEKAKCRQCNINMSNGRPVPNGEQNCKNEIDRLIAEMNRLATASVGDARGYDLTAEGQRNGDGASPRPAPGGGSSGGIGQDSLMAGGIGALAGGLAGFMLGKKEGEKKEREKWEEEQRRLQEEADNNQTNTDLAVQSNGQILCDKEDSGNYPECNEQLVASCTADLKANLSQTRCQNFANRYCTPNVAGAKSSGEGVGQSFCQQANAVNFCKAGGRDNCPSCVMLLRSRVNCTGNASLCAPQISQTQIDQAKTTCPSDPAFLNSGFASGSSIVASEPGVTVNAPNLVLPSDTTESTTASTTATNTNSLAVASPTATKLTPAVGANASTPVATSGNASGGNNGSGAGVAEGTQVNLGSSAGSGSTGGSGRARLVLARSVGGVDRETASGGAQAKASSTNAAETNGLRGPASDVQGPYGPSLFAMGSQVVKARCQAGKLLNCN